MAKKTTKLQINSFKNWTFGDYCITQYRRFSFIVSRDGSDLWQTKTLRGAVKYSIEHAHTGV